MDGIEEFSDLIHKGDGGLEGWIARNYGTLLVNLKDLANANKAYEVSSLSMVLLARIATVCSDSAPGSASLSTVLSEIFEVIQFVERKMRFTSFKNKMKYKFAKAAMEGPSSRDNLLKVFNTSY
ncbi:hypothetical protein Sjap_015359 [Stephania japonica]|uniref:Uncharacterized protein n=1 Tax=Stephania japonica TaxID=461633 RepID=A0AAP0IJ88_9MAGN